MDLRQRQPFLCAMLVIAVKLLDIAGAVGLYLESNALGFLSKIKFTATSRTAALSGLFSQETHRQEALQVARAAKHWQYLYNLSTCRFVTILFNGKIININNSQFQTSRFSTVASILR